MEKGGETQEEEQKQYIDIYIYKIKNKKTIAKSTYIKLVSTFLNYREPPRAWSGW